MSEAATAPELVEEFVLPQGDEDVIADLEAMGIVIDGEETHPRDLEQARREAVAGVYLMHATQMNQRIQQLGEARDTFLTPLLERVEKIKAHYAAEIQKQVERRDHLLRFVAYIAELSEYQGKKKSIATPFGTFGFRDVAPSVRLADEQQTLTWAQEKAPGFVQVDAKLRLTVAREYFTDSELEQSKQTLKWAELKKEIGPDSRHLPPGVERVDGGREFYAKPETL